MTERLNQTDMTIDEAYNQPSALEVDVEAIIGRHIARHALIVGPLIIGVAWLLRGGLGAVSAAAGVAIVVMNFVLSGLALAKAATVSMKVYHAVALLSFFVRLGLIMAAAFLVASLFEVDREALGVAAVVAYLTLLTWEAWAVMGGSRKEMEWRS